MSEQRIQVWSDGACRGNPGPGGWGALIRVPGQPDVELSGGEPATTNNRMELRAVVEALRSLPAGSQLTVHADSTYVLNGITKWLAGWRRNGWLTGSKQPVKNVDLWQDLDEQANRHTVDWQWVKGHAGDPGNERADALANEGVPGGMGAGPAGDGRPGRSRRAPVRSQAAPADSPGATAGGQGAPAGSAKKASRPGAMAARFPGTCPQCRAAIKVGDRIRQAGGQWVCAGCAAAA
ncbi:MAG TPA: ribonuclease HI [Nakamurella multipartita]|nr:ribonuclease HI [Nakamurella multipartita]